MEALVLDVAQFICFGEQPEAIGAVQMRRLDDLALEARKRYGLEGVAVERCHAAGGGYIDGPVGGLSQGASVAGRQAIGGREGADVVAAERIRPLLRKSPRRAQPRRAQPHHGYEQGSNAERVTRQRRHV